MNLTSICKSDHFSHSTGNCFSFRGSCNFEVPILRTCPVIICTIVSKRTIRLISVILSKQVFLPHSLRCKLTHWDIIIIIHLVSLSSICSIHCNFKCVYSIRIRTIYSWLTLFCIPYDTANSDCNPRTKNNSNFCFEPND